MEYCITINPIPHSQYRTKFDYEWSIEYQLIRNPLVSVNIRSANLLIFKILYYGMSNAVIKLSFYQTEYSRYSYSYVHRVFTLVFTELIDRTLRGQRTKSGSSTMT